VVVGGCFGGLACVSALRKLPVRVTLIDRQNYHLFQPLLYQVATAALSPSDVAIPIRVLLGVSIRRRRGSSCPLSRKTCRPAPLPRLRRWGSRSGSMRGSPASRRTG